MTFTNSAVRKVLASFRFSFDFMVLNVPIKLISSKRATYFSLELLETKQESEEV